MKLFFTTSLLSPCFYFTNASPRYIKPTLNRNLKQSCANRVNNTPKKLLQCVTVESVRKHQADFQHIADENNGIRASGTSGFDASADYVVEQLEAVGYDVVKQEFPFTFWDQLGPSTLESISPNSVTYIEGVDYKLMTFSSKADVSGEVTLVDNNGCDVSDFDGIDVGEKIALIKRGICSFKSKAENAAAAGAIGVVVINRPDDLSLGGQSLQQSYAGGIPAFFVGASLGDELATTPDLVLRIISDTITLPTVTTNVLAETSGGRDDQVVMVGAHLDSVTKGPGIQDDGSGSAAILEVAIQMFNVNPKNKVRFAWWGAEEKGLLGSDYYVSNLSDKERKSIAMYLNFDMIGSPNYVRFVTDGDGSKFGQTSPKGSGVIEKFFQDYYTSQGLAYEEEELDFRTDYAAFVFAGIPFGDIFTGAEGLKTEQQAVEFGGTAGEPYDPCYHLACDTFDNINLEVLEQNAHAIASATLHFSMIKDLPLALADPCSSNHGKKACEKAVGCKWNKKGGVRPVDYVDKETDEAMHFEVSSSKCFSDDSTVPLYKNKIVESADVMEQPLNSSSVSASATALALIAPMAMLWLQQ